MIITRKAASELRRLATQYPVVMVTGPRQSGKTTLCNAVFPDFETINLERLDTRQLALEDPRGFLARHNGSVVLDEIQRTPDLPSYLQPIVDAGDHDGPFIMTGSQQFEVHDTLSQSLAGRSALLKLLPFSLDEVPELQRAPSIEEVLYRGFYPRIYDKELNPTEALSFYVSTDLERDIRRLTRVQRLTEFERFLRLCSANVGQLLNYTRLANDCGIDQKTAKAWLSLLQASYIVVLLQPHHRNFRKRLTKSPKLYFYDVGLAAYLLGIEHPSHVMSHPLRGALFENLVVTELLKSRFNRVRESNLFFFRDHRGNEVDVILDHGPTVTPIEIKLGRTINADFFKGLDYYAQLNQDLAARYVVYGGATETAFKDVSILPHDRIDQIPN